MGVPNPEVIKWARKTAGLSHEDAARRLGMKGKSAVETLKAYEEGSKQPSRSRLLVMSKQYHRSYLTFFLQSPPQKVERGEDFRKLPDAEPSEFSGVLDALVRDIFVRKELVKEALIETEEDEVIPFVGGGASMPGVSEACRRVRDYFDIDVGEFRNHRNSHDAFNYLRGLVERQGIYVLLMGDLGTHHSQLNTEVFRGFALADDIAPFVVVNNYDAKTAWSFTLLHELVHLWLGKTGVSAQSYEHAVERYCNDVASQILLSDAEISDFFSGIQDQEVLAAIVGFTSSNNISGSLVAYRLFRAGFIDENEWKALRDDLRKRWLESKRYQKEKRKQQEGSSGSYYATQRHRVGGALLKVVRRSVGEGALTETKAGKVLGVSSGSVTEMLGV